MAWSDVNKEESDESISRINSAGLTNITLENLWRDCYSAMARGDLVLWNRKLDSIWIVLGGDCVDDDTNDKYIKMVDLKIYSAGNLSNKMIGFSRSTKNTPVNTAIQYQWLKNKSLFLKRLQNKQGKGTAYVNQDEDDLD